MTGAMTRMVVVLLPAVSRVDRLEPVVWIMVAVAWLLLGFTVSRFAFAFSRLAWLKWLKRRDSPGRREVEK